MLKKHFIFFLLTFAYGIVISHNIVPHHHHDTYQDLTEHHQTNHQDGNEDSGDLNHLFSHFVHPANGFTTLNNLNLSNSISKQLSLIAIALQDNFYLDEFSIPPLLFSPIAEHFIYNSPHSLASGLRAPPSFIG